MSYITPLDGGARSQEVSRQAFLHGLDLTLARYRDLGVRVVVVRQVPHQKYFPLDIYLRAYERSDVATTITHMSVDRATHEATQAYVDAAFADAAKRYDNLTLIDLSDSLCTSANDGANNGVCPIGSAETAYYYDDNHLSSVGSVRMAGPLWQALRDAGLAQAVVGDGS